MRLYELTVVIPGKRGKPPITKKIRRRAIDSIHASAEVMAWFDGKMAYCGRKSKVISAVLVKEDDE